MTRSRYRATDFQVLPHLAEATFTYDAHGRLISETCVIDGTAYPISYAYDAVGNLAGITYSDGVSVTCSIDPLKRATTVKKGGSTLANVTYTPSGVVGDYLLLQWGLDDLHL